MTQTETKPGKAMNLHEQKSPAIRQGFSLLLDNGLLHSEERVFDPLKLFDVAKQAANDGTASVSHHGAERIRRSAFRDGFRICLLAAKHRVYDVGTD